MRMKTEELIQKLHDHPRSTEVLLMFNEDSPTHWTDAVVYGQTFKLVIGEWDSLRPQLQAQKKPAARCSVSLPAAPECLAFACDSGSALPD